MWAAVLFVLTVTKVSHKSWLPYVPKSDWVVAVGVISYHFSLMAELPGYHSYSQCHALWCGVTPTPGHPWSGKSCNALEVALHCGLCICFSLFFSFCSDLE